MHKKLQTIRRDAISRRDPDKPPAIYGAVLRIYYGHRRLCSYA